MSASQYEAALKRDGVTLAEYHEQALGLHSLLHEICTTMTMRIQAVASSVEGSEAAIAAQKATTDDFLAANEPVIDKITRIFDALRTQLVDPDLVNGERDKTLFDFVDAETVASLQRDAQTRGAALRDLEVKHSLALEKIRSILSFYHSLEFRGLVDTSAHFEAASTAATDVWATLTSQVSALVQGTADNVAQHGRLLALTASSPLDPMTAQWAAEATGLVKSSQDAVDRLSSFYDAALEHFVDMEQSDRKIVECFTDMHDATHEYDAAYSEAHALYEELRTLHEFYCQFQGSFASLEAELERRRAFDAAQQATVRNMQATLRQAEDAERRAREAYAAEHMRFLPSSLSAVVQVLNGSPSSLIQGQTAPKTMRIDQAP
ncbi:hypothetical protein ACHHYP_08752 [Achlya hypogyna]|uniref:Autophagy protein ATG17-like domain-containing protein n=1 Tax=Achlya hypogyna TaxID=1202772 RepID=A0A1V9ZK08_ACHHY|nr:hypothetical protein ACHHYP_08752 [Achlya hypogyna]